ncbi:MAG: hypothetical protein V1725_05335 [archaeon]
MTDKKIGLETIADKLGTNNVRTFFKYARNRYLAARNLENQPEHDAQLETSLTDVATALGEKPENTWGSQKFQLAYRATRPEHLRMLGISESQCKEAEEATAAGRVMSLLPYNTVMRETTIRKYLPSKPEKFSGNWRHSIDPYGLFRKMDKVEAIDKEGKSTYLATRKFPYAVLANITEACHFGCDGCYKGSMVRTALSALEGISPEYAKLKKQLTIEEERAVEQAKLLTQWLNKHPEVDTIIMSGGEPTLFSNHSLERIIGEYKKAEHVKAVRLCTSSVFQGMWYRMDDGLAKIMQDFEKETGKQFYVNAHVTDEYQLSAPEAKLAVDKLNNAGITVHLQLPLQEGINFRRDDLEWSAEKLSNISKQAYALDVVPYKMIVDMHSPSHPDVTVPIETVSKVISDFDEHMEHSDMERWQAYNVLHEQGNLYLYPFPHFTAVKEVDQERGRVTYFIPKKDSVHTYEEPLIAGQNDDPDSLAPITDKKLQQKIAQVRSAYHTLRDKINILAESGKPFEQQAKEIETFEKEYYALSGITYPKNEPLMLTQ